VSALLVNELTFDAELELDHSALGALAHHHVIKSQRLEELVVAPVHASVEQHAVFGYELAVEHGADGLHHRPGRNVREKTDPPLVYADQGNVVRRNRPCDVQHRAVTPDHDREIGDSPELFEWKNRIFSDFHVRRRQLVDDDLDLA